MQLREAFSALTNLISSGPAPSETKSCNKGPGSPTSQAVCFGDFYCDEEAELGKIDQTTAQIKLGFQLLMKPDFVDLLQAFNTEHSTPDKSFECK